MAKTAYDPAKRRAYYLKNRQLKGRKKGKAKPPPKEKKPQMSPEMKAEMKQAKEQVKADTKAQRAALAALMKNAIAQIREKIKQYREKAKADAARVREQKKLNKSKGVVVQEDYLDQGAIDTLKANIDAIKAGAQNIREKITENHDQKMLNTENQYREKAGMDLKAAAPKPTATASSTTLNPEYAKMLPK